MHDNLHSDIDAKNLYTRENHYWEKLSSEIQCITTKLELGEPTYSIVVMNYIDV